MSIINKHISIPKNVATKDDLDFDFLKQKGIEYIEELGGSLWTDFNTHDPGITMLEMLSYAITDLGMRINMPIENLLNSKNSAKSINKQFYKAAEIFPSKPVTELDYRKLFIDIKEIKNCWLRPFTKAVYADCSNNKLSYTQTDFNEIHPNFKKQFNLKGLYTIFLDLEDNVSLESIEEKVREKYHENRNLCEDLVCIEEVKEQEIAVCANIEIEKEADEEFVYAKILLAINNYLSPSLQFYGVKEMIAKGYSPDQIFDGPVLKNGFLDVEELKNADLKKEVRLSDIMQLIMSVDGVKLINEISINNCNNTETEEEQWNIDITDNQKPVLCKKSNFNFSKSVLPLNIEKSKVDLYLNQLETEIKEAQKNAREDKKLNIPNGISLAVDSYTTIQNDFPDTYGINQDGLAVRATTERKSQAKQLKGYLLFFDQILANYFQHLGKIKGLLSINGTYKQTFFTQAIKDVKGFDELVKDYPITNNDKLSKILFESFDNNIERRNELLDHLLARFAEKFGEYTFVMKTLYGDATANIVLANKEAFFNDYVAISSERGSGFNYYKQPETNLWNTNNVAGIQKRIARLLGIKNYSRRSLSNSFIEIYEIVYPSKTYYRWRLRNAFNKIILSSTTRYTSTNKAIKELYFAVLQIIKTDRKEVIALFNKDFIDKSIVGNLYLHQSTSGKYSFHIINNEFNEGHTDYIVAKKYRYYTNLENFKNGILDIMDFLKYEFTEEGIFLVEHILLRPNFKACKNSSEIEILDEENPMIDTDLLDDNLLTTDNPEENSENNFLPIYTNNCTDICSLDPYSYKVSIVLPGFTFRFSNPDFRNYMETIIKEELPAHILPKICWVGERKNTNANIDNDLEDFETTYEEYLYAKTKLDYNQNQPSELKEFINALTKLNSIYPVATLIDCNDESDELDGRIILGQTILGTL